MTTTKVKVFSLGKYLDAALKLAVYEKDETGVIVAAVPGASGFFTQGESYEEARENLKDAIEGNVLLALQLGWDIPHISGVDISEGWALSTRNFMRQ